MAVDAEGDDGADIDEEPKRDDEGIEVRWFEALGEEDGGHGVGGDGKAPYPGGEVACGDVRRR